MIERRARVTWIIGAEVEVGVNVDDADTIRRVGGDDPLKSAPRGFVTAADHQRQVTVGDCEVYTVCELCLRRLHRLADAFNIARVVDWVFLMPRQVRERLAQRPRPVSRPDAAAVAADALVAGKAD